jgi:hypothetical protein
MNANRPAPPGADATKVPRLRAGSGAGAGAGIGIGRGELAHGLADGRRGTSATACRLHRVAAR